MNEHMERMEREIPKVQPKRHYSLMKKEDKIKAIQFAFGLTHGKGKRKKKGRKK